MVEYRYGGCTRVVESFSFQMTEPDSLEMAMAELLEGDGSSVAAIEREQRLLEADRSSGEDEGILDETDDEGDKKLVTSATNEMEVDTPVSPPITTRIPVKTPATIDAPEDLQTAPPSLTTGTNTVPDRDGHPPATVVTPSLYDRVRRMNEVRRTVIDMASGTVTKAGQIGGFGAMADPRYDAYRNITFQGMGRSVSLSFNAVTLECLACPVKHRIHEGAPLAFLLCDQACPASLASSSGLCIRVVRMEDASLLELVDYFCKLLGGTNFGMGGVVIVSSASHLGLVGTQAYIEDLLSVAGRVRVTFREKFQVAAGPPLLFGGTSDSGLLRSICEVAGWAKCVKSGRFRVPDTHEAAIAVMTEGFDGEWAACPPCSFRLPSTFEPGAKRESWQSKNWLFPPSTKPLSAAGERAIVAALRKELEEKMAITVDVTGDRLRALPTEETIDAVKKKFVVVGATHAANLAKALASLGLGVALISKADWRATTGIVQSLCKEVKQVLEAPGFEEATLVVHALDKNLYMGRMEDGSLIPPRKIEGRYHLEGEISLALKESQKRVFNLGNPYWSWPPHKLGF